MTTCVRICKGYIILLVALVHHRSTRALEHTTRKNPDCIYIINPLYVIFLRPENSKFTFLSDIKFDWHQEQEFFGGGTNRRSHSTLNKVPPNKHRSNPRVPMVRDFLTKKYQQPSSVSCFVLEHQLILSFCPTNDAGTVEKLSL